MLIITLAWVAYSVEWEADRGGDACDGGRPDAGVRGVY